MDNTDEVKIDDIEVEFDDTEFEYVKVSEAEEIEAEFEEEDLLPANYLHITNIVLKEQLVGVVDKDADLFVMPAYAMRRGSMELIDYIEFTAENITEMKLLGLGVEFVRRNKETIFFNRASDYLAIAKTLKRGDTIDIVFDDVPTDSTING